MEPQELAEAAEKARASGEHHIGLTMAIFAVMLAAATLMTARAQTSEMVLETQATDQWNYYQAKNIRHHVYDADAQIANLFGDKGAQDAANFHALSLQQQKDSEAIQTQAENLGKQVEVSERKASFSEGSELCLEVAIVLASISLLAASNVYWKFSFLFAATGFVLLVWALLFVRA